MQGALSDRWFLGALGAIATNSDLLKQLIVSRAHASRGLYTVKFHKSGHWRYVHVDDRIPCNRSGMPHYAHSPDPNEVWVMIAEKAFAKLHGCYEAVSVGSLEDGLRDVAGAHASTVPISTEASFWTDMNALFSRGSIITALDSRPRMEPLDPVGAHNRPAGLLKSHPYVVMQLKEATADATAQYDALDVRMIRFYNPWHLGGWNGDWSAGHSLWKQYPPIADACGVSDTHATAEPTFWIEWNDFVARFDTIVVTYSHETSGSRIMRHGSWILGDDRSGAGGNPSSPTWAANPQYCFDILRTTSITVSLSQLDLRWHKADQGDTYQPIGFTVHSVHSGRRASSYNSAAVAARATPFRAQRTVAADFVLKPGCYVIVPATFKSVSITTPFVLEMNTNKSINFHEVPEVQDDATDGDSTTSESGAAFDFEIGSAVDNLGEPPGRELRALWEQAAHLADVIKTLSNANSEIEAKIKRIEDAAHAPNL